MGKLTPQKFTVESFQDQASWIGDLIGPLNSVLNDLVINFNNQLTIKDNLYQEIREIKFKNDSVNFPIRFKAKFQTFPQGMTCIYVYNNTDSNMEAANPIVSWTYLNGDIVIQTITGLTASEIYTLRFHVIYG